MRPLMQSALAGLTAQSEAFDRAAAAVARGATGPAETEGSANVQISSAARDANQTQGRQRENPESALTSGLESAIVDTRMVKYAFMANLKVLQTGAELEKAAADLLKPKH